MCSLSSPLLPAHHFIHSLFVRLSGWLSVRRYSVPVSVLPVLLARAFWKPDLAHKRSKSIIGVYFQEASVWWINSRASEIFFRHSSCHHQHQHPHPATTMRNNPLWPNFQGKAACSFRFTQEPSIYCVHGFIWLYCVRSVWMAPHRDFSLTETSTFRTLSGSRTVTFNWTNLCILETQSFIPRPGIWPDKDSVV